LITNFYFKETEGDTLRLQNPTLSERRKKEEQVERVPAAHLEEEEKKEKKG